MLRHVFAVACMKLNISIALLSITPVPDEYRRRRCFSLRGGHLRPRVRPLSGSPARRGLKVEAFAIGFGPKIFAWVRDGIEYSVRWIPAGGFVKLPQMVTSAAIEGEAGQGAVSARAAFVQNPGRRRRAVDERRFCLRHRHPSSISSACPCRSIPPSSATWIRASPEAKLGIQDGRQIVAVNGKPVRSWEEVNKITTVWR